MVNLPLKTRHQQFGFQLIMIILTLILIFSVWYLFQKRVSKDLQNDIELVDDINNSLIQQ